jgi:pantoate--beta-alanine ligase
VNAERPVRGTTLAMRTTGSIGEMQALSMAARRAGRRIGLVPTMGYLHAGHAALMREARARCDLLVVSLFVNPTQFGPGEDFARYPRDLDRDSRVCEAEHVDVLFCPEAADMYAPGSSVWVEETALSAELCGRYRPGHFRGVTTVVAKLFHIVGPDVATFGQKDAQQAQVIRRMVRDLNFPIEVVICPTVREADGLAMSSRNAYLSDAERRRAASLYRSLCRAQELYAAGIRSAATIVAAVRDVIGDGTLPVDIEYVEVVACSTLKPVEDIREPALLALAVRVGKTRLIDNAVLGA